MRLRYWTVNNQVRPKLNIHDDVVSMTTRFAEWTFGDVRDVHLWRRSLAKSYAGNSHRTGGGEDGRSGRI